MAGLPAHLHRFGPKTYKSYFLAYCWFITQNWTKSLRQTQLFLYELGVKKIPHWTTIQKASARFSGRVLSLLHKLEIANENPYICAVDSTGFSLSNPSRHYTNVIHGKVRCPGKLSVLVDTRTNKALALHFRPRKAHDVKDFPKLLTNLTRFPKKIVGDSAYDAEEKVFSNCYERGIIAVVKPRKNAKRGFYRHKMRKHNDKRTYNRRPTVEGFFSRLKQRFGGNLRCRTARTQRAEICARVILQNLSSALHRLFLHDRSFH